MTPQKETARERKKVYAFMDAHPTMDAVDRMALYGAAERDAATEQCCKDMCENCRNGETVFLNEYGVWFHPEASSSPFKCAAEPIRARVAQEKRA